MLSKVCCAALVASAIVVGVAPAAVANAAPYKNCTEARDNGDTNIPSSSDKYGSHLDRDGDGIGCES
ncbi:excalibur calcium-binding domain-containing protein [Mycolicibacterium sp. 3033]|nr:excalibur calcium-binding domain-containing protein [Mycolicibacterium aurantiacum]